MKRWFTLSLAYLVVASAAVAEDAQQPILTDSRIKTFVYNENRVYTLLTEAGYQSNIEFGLSEEVETISVGDRIAWQIVPAGRRLFVRAMEDGAHTNMTVVTSRRTYQIDLTSVRATAGNQADITYVARFYYPDEKQVQEARILTAQDVLDVASLGAALNYNYTYTGPEEIAPLKIFDNGRETYFKFRGHPSPTMATVGSDGMETRIASRTVGEYVVVSTTAPRFVLRLGDRVVCVFNESSTPVAVAR